MASVNKVILVGNVQPRDAELRFTSGGTPVAKFTLATEKFGKNLDPKERTEWHNIVVWGKQAEFCGEYVKKGKQVYIEGRIETRKWDDKEGKKQYKTEIIAQVIQLLGRREDGAGGGRREDAYEDASLDRMVDDYQGGAGGTGSYGDPGGAPPAAGKQGPADELGGEDDLPF